MSSTFIAIYNVLVLHFVKARGLSLLVISSTSFVSIVDIREFSMEEKTVLNITFALKIVRKGRILIN